MFRFRTLPILAALVGALFLVACDAPPPAPPESSPTAEVAPPEAPSAEFAVDFERYELDNGLTVILHVDRSDPVVAVALTAHVVPELEWEILTMTKDKA